MNKRFLFLLFPVLLSGCVGYLAWDDTGCWTEDFPDIRTVPNRECARAPRCVCEKNEKLSRLNDLNSLEKEREQIAARDQALREKAFQSDDTKHH